MMNKNHPLLLSALILLSGLHAEPGRAAVRFAQSYSITLDNTPAGSLERQELTDGTIKLTLRLHCQSFPKYTQNPDKLKRQINALIYRGIHPRTPQVLEFLTAFHTYQYRHASLPRDYIQIEYTIVMPSLCDSGTTSDEAGANSAASEKSTAGAPAFSPFSITLKHSSENNAEMACCWFPATYSDNTIPYSYKLNAGPGYYAPPFHLLSDDAIQEKLYDDDPDEGLESDTPEDVPHPAPGSTLAETSNLLAQQVGEDSAIGATALFSTHHEALLNALWTGSIDLSGQPFIAFQNPMEIIPGSCWGYTSEPGRIAFFRQEQTLVVNHATATIIQRDPNRDQFPTGNEIHFILDENQLISKISMISSSGIGTLTFRAINK